MNSANAQPAPLTLATPEATQQLPPGSMEKSITEAVLQRLGKPAGYAHTDVRKLFPINNGAAYRVNIFVLGPSTMRWDRKLAYSFFLEVDGEGQILASNPQIEHVLPAVIKATLRP